MLHRLRWALWLTVLTVPLAWGGTVGSSPLLQLLESVDVPVGHTAPDPLRLEASPTRSGQFPLYKSVMAQPMEIPYRVGMLAQGYRQAAASPYDLIALTGSVAGVAVVRPKSLVLADLEKALRASDDPLAASLAWMPASDGKHKPWRPALPDAAHLPDPLRFELAVVLAAMGQANQFLRRALAQMPAAATPALLRRQAFDSEMVPFEEPDYRALLAQLDRTALLAGMLDLTAAVERLAHYVSTARQLPVVSWTLATPFGQIVVDTTARNNTYRLKDPLLVLDVGGDDVYEFLPPSDTHHISVVLDHKGNDRYLAATPGSDPSAATLGYGVLWDTEGDDSYQGTQHAQASALFGAALLVDGGGHNQFSASSHAQGQAIAGHCRLRGPAGRWRQ